MLQVTSEFLIAIIIGVLVWLLILYSLIEGASRSKKIERQLRIQTDLLAEMARQQGISANDIELIVKQK